MLSGLKTALEFGQVPAVQIRPVVYALLGMLHIRCRAGLRHRNVCMRHPVLVWPTCLLQELPADFV